MKVSAADRQYSFCLWDLMDKSLKDLDVIDLSEPRHAQYLQKAWKRHQNAVYWVDVNLPTKKGLTFYQTRSNAIILQETLPAYCISESCEDGIWWSPRRKSKHVTSVSTKHLFKTRKEKRIGFRTRSTIRSWAAIWKFPIEPTNSNSNLWENGETRYQGWRERSARRKKNVPFSGDRC